MEVSDEELLKWAKRCMGFADQQIWTYSEFIERDQELAEWKVSCEVYSFFSYATEHQEGNCDDDSWRDAFYQLAEHAWDLLIEKVEAGELE